MKPTEFVYVVYYIQGEEQMYFFAGNLLADDTAAILEYVNAASRQDRRVEIIAESEFVRRGGQIMYFSPY